MSGRRARRKGHDWERETARRLSAAIGAECRRNVSESQTGNAGDVVLPDWVPLSIQCKAGGRPPVFEALEEAAEAAKPGQIPVAILRRTKGVGRKSDEVAVLELGDFYRLVELLVKSRAWTP